MKSNRQARHILGLDHKISNQRKICKDDKSPQGWIFKKE
ncbi:TPA: stationary-phase-induced ribosome-associated protein [Escherichia coli]|nr:stationary-phase-induced ribosome-associated protein [Escherichia coli]